MSDTGLPPPELSRPVVADRIGTEPQTHRIEASAAECAALARRLGVPAIASFAATLTAERLTDGTIDVSGVVETALTLVCVVTLEPFDDVISGAVEGRYGSHAIASDDPALPDIEAIEAGRIDLGELAVQSLALALPDHPRSPAALAAPAPGTGLEDAGEDEPGSANGHGRISPFAGLKSLIRPPPGANDT